MVTVVVKVERQSRAMTNNNNMNTCRNFRRQKCDQERSWEDSEDLTKEILRMWHVKTKVIGSTNNGQV
jgi:hypothetical protein